MTVSTAVCFVFFLFFLLQLEELPVGIGQLQNLQILNLCNNRLMTLPNELGLLKNLHTLNLGLNQLDSLPASISALKELQHIGLSDNLFTRVPGCLSRLNKLVRVNLDRNPLLTKQVPNNEPAIVTEGFYMVKENLLCEDCLNKCKNDIKKREDVTTSEPILQPSSLALGGRWM